MFVLRAKALSINRLTQGKCATWQYWMAFFQDIEGVWIFQGCGMVQRKVRHFRSYSHKIRWGFEFWGRWKGRSQRLCLWIMVRLWCRWHRWSTCMFRWSCIAISLHFLIGKSLFSSFFHDPGGSRCWRSLLPEGQPRTQRTSRCVSSVVYKGVWGQRLSEIAREC